MLDQQALSFLLKRYLPQGIAPETRAVLSMALEEVAEESPDRQQWQESLWDLLADDTGLLDLLEDDPEDPETALLETQVNDAAQAITDAAFGAGNE